MERSARPIWKAYIDFIQLVYFDTALPWQRLVLHPLAVTWWIVEPRYRAPFDFHSTSNLRCLPAAMRNQNVYPYWLRLSFLRKRVVAWCHFEHAPSFPAHNFFYWSHTDSWLVTNKTLLPHPPLLFGSFIPYAVDCALLRMFRVSCGSSPSKIMSLLVKQATCGLCDVHGSAMRRLLLENWSATVFWKNWRCGGDAHVQIHKSICVYLCKHVFLSSEMTFIDILPTPGSTSNPIYIRTYW